MGLRDENPLVDSDLLLIISTFSKGMIHSMDESSVFAGFRADVMSMQEIPRSVLKASDVLPVVKEAEVGTVDTGVTGNRAGGATATTPAALNIATLLEDADERQEALESSPEDAEDENSFIEKVGNWVEDCIPCDFRSWSKLNPDLLKEMGGEWLDIFEGIESKLNDLDNLLDSNDIFSELCEIFSALKFNCVPDLKKIIWLLTFLLKRMMTEWSFDLGTFDQLITSILGPIFNEMAANLNLLGDLALGPLRCVLDQLVLVTQGVGQSIAQAQTSMSSFRATRSDVRRSVEDSAARRRVQAQERSRQQASERLQSAVAATSNISRGIRDLNRQTGIGRLTRYIDVGYTHVKEYQQRLIGLLQELVDNGLDQWGDRISMGSSKMDILRLIAIIKATIETAQDGNISCGPDADDATEDELKALVNSYIHPSEHLDFSVEHGTFVVRKTQSRREEDLAEAAETPVEGDQVSGTQLPNIVFQKPISSCLKKVTEEEASKVQLWIRQLEEEMND